MRDENITKEDFFENLGVNAFKFTVLEIVDGGLSVVSLDQILEGNKAYYVESPSPVEAEI